MLLCGTLRRCLCIHGTLATEKGAWHWNLRSDCWSGASFLTFWDSFLHWWKWRHQSAAAIWGIEEIIAAKSGHPLPVAATVNCMNLMPSKEAIHSLISLEVKSSKRGVGKVTSLWKTPRGSSLPQSTDDVSKCPLAVCIYLLWPLPLFSPFALGVKYLLVFIF